MITMTEQMLALAETESERRLVRRWLALDEGEHTARSMAWEQIRAGGASRGTDSAASELARFAVRTVYA